MPKHHQGLPLEEDVLKEIRKGKDEDGNLDEEIYVSVWKIKCINKEIALKHERGKLATTSANQVYNVLMTNGFNETAALIGTGITFLFTLRKEINSMPLSEYNEKYNIT